MEFKKVMERIDFLYHKGKETILSEEERREQLKLKALYLDVIKDNFRLELNNVESVS